MIGTVKVVLVVATVLGIGGHGSDGAAPAPGASGALLVVGDSWRHIAHTDAQQATDVNTHFHCCGDRKNVYPVVFRNFAGAEHILKPSLNVARFVTRNGSCVFYGLYLVGIGIIATRLSEQCRLPEVVPNGVGRNGICDLSTPVADVEQSFSHYILASGALEYCVTDRMEFK